MSRLAGRRAVVDPAADDAAAADPVAGVSVKHRVGPRTRPASRLGVGGDVGVVVHGHGQASAFAQPVPEREVLPAGEMTRAAHTPGAPVHQAAEADPHRAPIQPGLASAEHLGDLRAHPFAARGRIYRQLLTVEDFALGSPGDELELGPADFNA